MMSLFTNRRSARHCIKLALPYHTMPIRNIFWGRSDAAGIQLLAQDHPLSVTLGELAKQKMEYYWALINSGIPILPGILETIKQLAPSYQLALTTGATKPEVDAVFVQYKLTSYFTIVVTAEDFSKSKPDPEPYLFTAKKLGLPPEQCIVIEDSVAGIEAAHAAGMKCIAITNSFTTAQLKKANKIVNSAAQITPQLINSL